MDEAADPEANPFGRVVGHWDRVLDDMAATAASYRDAGRTVLELHPGDVTLLTGEPRTLAETKGAHDPGPRDVGFDVVVPGDEFERLQATVDDRELDRYELFRATGDGLVFLLVAMEYGDNLAVLVPLYYDQTDRADLERIAREHGLSTHVRPLDESAVVTIAHTDPTPFLED